MTRRSERCIVCQERPAGAAVCDVCAKSFERDGGDTHADHITWAAKRTRHFERKHAREAQHRAARIELEDRLARHVSESRVVTEAAAGLKR